tara:strand:- start:93 stop:293 length:201 start_codon:yes stop_codon:yes gene_type:complete
MTDKPYHVNIKMLQRKNKMQNEIKYYGFEIWKDWDEKWKVAILGWEWEFSTLEEAKKLVKENWRRG